MARETRTLLLTWAALMALLAITVTAALSPIGVLRPMINLGAALTKAALIYWVFMHLKEVRSFLRVAAVGAAAWILILGSLVWSDLATRLTG
jgi:cytochrome c oxidase subunit 4